MKLFFFCQNEIYGKLVLGDVMPELPEVETIKETLKSKLLNHTIKGISIYYPNIIDFPNAKEFEQKIIGETIHNLERRGKWILFELDHYYLLSHLRMEGRYLFRTSEEKREKHEHIVFLLENGVELRYKDTRKFGRMHLIEKEKLYDQLPLSELGLEPWDVRLTSKYLKQKLSHKTIPIKTSLLDQSIITGIGNIYANEILFLCKINPIKPSNQVKTKELESIIQHTKIVLESAIHQGGTTIRSYEASEGVHGRFQQNLYVHGKEEQPCPTCQTTIRKINIGGRGTYYCPKCQK